MVRIFNFNVFIWLKKVYYRLIGDFYGELSSIILYSVGNVLEIKFY